MTKCRDTSIRKAYILLRGDNLKPERVSTILGVKPSSSQVRGEPRDNVRRIADNGMWKLVAQSTSSLSSQVSELVATVADKRVRLDALEGVDEALFVFFIALDKDRISTEAIDFLLTPQQLHELARLGLSVEMNGSYLFGDQ